MTVSGPGHNMLFSVGDELFTAYHTHTYPQAPSGNRQLCIDRAGFHADGTAYICGPTLAPQLRPLKELNLRSLLPLGTAEGDESGLLTDGDSCVSTASAAWIWRGTQAVFRWEEPVKADLLILYPAPGETIGGTLTVNSSLTAELSLAAGGKPGEALILAFEPMEITELSLDFAEECGLGEAVLIGE